MGEPDLEEERLTASAAAGTLAIERRTMGDAPAPAQVTTPSGAELIAPFAPVAEGRYVAELDIDETGLHRVRSGDLTSVAAAGPLNPRELADLALTEDALRPFVDATDGIVFYAGDGAAARPPAVRRTRSALSQVKGVLPAR